MRCWSEMGSEWTGQGKNKKEQSRQRFLMSWESFVVIRRQDNGAHVPPARKLHTETVLPFSEAERLVHGIQGLVGLPSQTGSCSRFLSPLVRLKPMCRDGVGDGN